MQTITKKSLVENSPSKPAKAADVGISVDSAVDIAKESSDIILLKPSLLILQEGVIEGRKVFGNIIRRPSKFPAIYGGSTRY